MKMEKMWKKSKDGAGASTGKSKLGFFAGIVFFGMMVMSFVPMGAQGAAVVDEVQGFTALLNGGQEGQASTSKAFGVAFMTYNEKTRILCYSITFTDDKLSGSETAAHIHGPGAPGDNVAVLFALPAGNPKNGCTTKLTLSQARQLKKGLFYINIHTQAAPNGEIRGQILPVSGEHFGPAK
jgi:CHRD domain-containing protein